MKATNNMQFLCEFVLKPLTKKICIGRAAKFFSKDQERYFLFNRTATIQTTNTVSEGMEERISFLLAKEVYCAV